MPATFDVHNGQIDIIFKWRNIPIALAQEIVFGSALYRWRLDKGPRDIINPGTSEEETIRRLWEDLTDQDKLDIVYRGAQALIIAEARTALVNTGTEEAREMANEYADNNYELPE